MALGVGVVARPVTWSQLRAADRMGDLHQPIVAVGRCIGHAGKGVMRVNGNVSFHATPKAEMAEFSRFGRLPLGQTFATLHADPHHGFWHGFCIGEKPPSSRPVTHPGARTRPTGAVQSGGGGGRQSRRRSPCGGLSGYCRRGSSGHPSTLAPRMRPAPPDRRPLGRSFSWESWWLTGGAQQPPQPRRIAHSRTDAPQPSTCQAQEPAAVSWPPSTSIASAILMRACTLVSER